MNRAQLTPESVSTRSGAFSRIEDASTLAMADMRVIAEYMISSGYAKECMKIYKIVRKSVVDESIYKLGVERISSSRIHKMDWKAVD
ncbi:hypothetical protein ACS0TY_027131 [Phlomoides rotata]